MTGTLHILGVGPGDPELVTLRAARIMAAAPVFACFARRGRAGHARSIAAPHLNPAAEELRFEYPYTTDLPVDDPRYPAAMTAFYDESAAAIAAHLRASRDVALLCEGDPFLYGSAMYLFDRLRGAHPVAVTPGITAMSGCWSRAASPMVHGDDILSVLPATLPAEELAGALRRCDAAVVMKLGRNLPKLRAVLDELGLTGRAIYAERGCMEGERILPLAERDTTPAPYFALVLIPGRQGTR
ncbi:precorrin-2 C(20)-methyltransferase [Teichococcus oryzae]|uniref:Precorrin-2 C(20)-methyltransferase n=1 Tax=Teichococcus oryzae TaxID=1608942 RepID=A0A5B2TCJ6_9PROT|nr:precorrin-2 C(20)-methyltransferase [Pseudoroseomonas oryzae]KAA2211805.1 precorrin-2 C(20)-methyltransferase [Pseudoroseomonas oryzae]